MKAYWGSRGIAPLIFKLSTGRIRKFDSELSEPQVIIKPQVIINPQVIIKPQVIIRPQVIITTIALLSYSFESNESTDFLTYLYSHVVFWVVFR